MLQLPYIYELLEALKVNFDLKPYMTLTTGLVFASSLLASYVIVKSCRNQYSVVPRWPPGPKPWPIIGNVLDLKPKEGQNISETFQELADKYGDVIHVIREAYVDHADVFSNRPTHLDMLKQAKLDKGIIMSNGDTWKRIRRFTLKTLRDFGVGKAVLERAVQKPDKLLESY